MKWLDGISDSMDTNLSKLQETVKGREAWHTSWGGKESDVTQQLDKNKNIKLIMMTVPCIEGTCCPVKYLGLCCPVQQLQVTCDCSNN